MLMLKDDPAGYAIERLKVQQQKLDNNLISSGVCVALGVVTALLAPKIIFYFIEEESTAKIVLTTIAVVALIVPGVIAYQYMQHAHHEKNKNQLLSDILESLRIASVTQCNGLIAGSSALPRPGQKKGTLAFFISPPNENFHVSSSASNQHAVTSDAKKTHELIKRYQQETLAVYGTPSVLEDILLAIKFTHNLFDLNEKTEKEEIKSSAELDSNSLGRNSSVSSCKKHTSFFNSSEKVEKEDVALSTLSITSNDDSLDSSPSASSCKKRTKFLGSEQKVLSVNEVSEYGVPCSIK